MIESLFPEQVLTVVATAEMWSGALHPAEEACVQRAVAKRRREFTAGRVCARAALHRLGVRDFPLLVGSDRLPLWPPGIVGSISHCAGYCGVAVARRDQVTGVGLDVETAEPLARDLLPMICKPSEISRIDSLGTLEPLLWAKMIFSAKESAYKCYFPLTRSFLEFHDVEVEISPRSRTFTARLVRESAPAAGGLRSFQGRFERDAAHLFTGVAIPGSEGGSAA